MINTYYITNHYAKGDLNEIEVSPLKDFSEFAIKDPTAIFIDHNEELFEQLKILRQRSELQIALAPVFICVRGNPLSSYLSALCDDVLEGNLINEKSLLDFCKAKEFGIHTILEKIKRLQQDYKEDANDQYSVEHAVLRYMYSRDVVLKAAQNAKSVYGFTYPIMDVVFDANSFQSFSHLKFLQERDLVSTKFVDKVHHCPHCFCAFLNFRETCVTCSSANLSSQDLLHHYRCGYEGPESDFDNGDKLECVKCHHELKQIGVDYDRPAQIHQCLDCNQVFQEPVVMASCMQCGVETEVAALVGRNVYNYTLTPLGSHAAIHGIRYSLKDEFKSLTNFVDEVVFKKFLEVELNRIRRYKKSASSCVKVVLKNYTQLAADGSWNLNDVNQEIADIIIKSIRSTDLLCFLNSTTIYLIFTETDVKWSEYTIDRVKNRLIEIIKKSTDVTMEIEYTVKAIDTDVKNIGDFFREDSNV